MKDLTVDNITENTVRINSQSSDARLTFLLERLVNHLHDFARETRLSTKEWMVALEFLTAVGQICSDVRQVGYPYIRPFQEFELLTSTIRSSFSSQISSACPFLWIRSIILSQGIRLKVLS